MKHSLSLLLLLSIPGSVFCSAPKGRRNSDTAPALVGQHPTVKMPYASAASSHPLQFHSSESPSTPLPTRKLVRIAGTRTTHPSFTKWHPVQITLQPNQAVQKIINAHPAHKVSFGKNSNLAECTLSAVLTDHHSHFGPTLARIPSLGGLVEAARLRRVNYGKDATGDTTIVHYATPADGTQDSTKRSCDKHLGILQQLIRPIEQTGNFPQQEPMPTIDDDQSRNFEEQMLAILANTKFELSEQRRRIGALLTEETRNHLNKTLPSALQLTLISLTSYQQQIAKDQAMFTGIDFAKKPHISRLAKQIGVGDTEMLNDTEKMVGPEFRALVQNLRNAQCTLAQMEHLQTLRDAQCAFVKGGTSAALKLALLAPKRTRAEKGLAAVDALLKQAPAESLETIKAVYAQRLEHITELEKLARGEKLEVAAPTETQTTLEAGTTSENSAPTETPA